MKFSIQTKLRLLLFVILLLGGALFGLFCWLIKMLQMWILLLFVAIFIYFILVEWLSEHSKSKPMKFFLQCHICTVYMCFSYYRAYKTIYCNNWNIFICFCLWLWSALFVIKKFKLSL